MYCRFNQTISPRSYKLDKVCLNIWSHSQRVFRLLYTDIIIHCIHINMIISVLQNTQVQFLINRFIINRTIMWTILITYRSNDIFEFNLKTKPIPIVFTLDIWFYLSIWPQIWKFNNISSLDAVKSNYVFIYQSLNT